MLYIILWSSRITTSRHLSQCWRINYAVIFLNPPIKNYNRTSGKTFANTNTSWNPRFSPSVWKKRLYNPNSFDSTERLQFPVTVQRRLGASFLASCKCQSVQRQLGHHPASYDNQEWCLHADEDHLILKEELKGCMQCIYRE